MKLVYFLSCCTSDREELVFFLTRVIVLYVLFVCACYVEFFVFRVSSAVVIVDLIDVCIDLHVLCVVD